MVDPPGADGARVADVAHLPVREVESDPEADQSQDRDHEEDGGRERDEPLAGAARAKAGHQHPHQEVCEHRIDERDRGTDLALVEEEVRHAEPAHEHQQVEMEHPERPARVEERRHEQQAERQPDVPGVEPFAEVAVVAARHHPGRLGALPGFDHLAGPAVDGDVGQLVAPREVADAPVPAALEEGDVVRAQVRVPAALAANLGCAVRDPDRLPRADGGQVLLDVRRDQQVRLWSCAARFLAGCRRRKHGRGRKHAKQREAASGTRRHGISSARPETDLRRRNGARQLRKPVPKRGAPRFREAPLGRRDSYMWICARKNSWR